MEQRDRRKRVGLASSSELVMLAPISSSSTTGRPVLIELVS
ncbi:hypothetical protein [Sandaracinus amylolyticus]|nr:hypothetical protein [Sandaracinus amylolyticus]